MIDFPLAALAFSAGMASFFSPCAAALLPAFASLYISGGSQSSGMARRVARGAFFGIIATLGFVLLFVSAGAVIILLGSSAAFAIPYVGMLLGAGIAFLGFQMFFGKELYIPVISLLPSISGPRDSSISSKGVFAYGIVYATTSLGCTLPIFLAVVTASFAAGGLAGGVLTFLLYALGKGTLMIIFTIALAVSKEAMLNTLNKMKSKMRHVTSFVLIAAGFYLIYIYTKLVLPV